MGDCVVDFLDLWLSVIVVCCSYFPFLCLVSSKAFQIGSGLLYINFVVFVLGNAAVAMDVSFVCASLKVDWSV